MVWTRWPNGIINYCKMVARAEYSKVCGVPRGNRTPNFPLGGEGYIRLTMGTSVFMIAHLHLFFNCFSLALQIQYTERNSMKMN